MPLVRITPKAGVNSQISQVQNSDGYFASNLIRWRFGVPEKIGGWTRLIQSVCAGFIRTLHAWQDLANNKNLLIGTDGGAQIIVNDTLYNLTFSTQAAQGGDITFCNFSVGVGLTLVTVAVPSTVVVQGGATVTFLMPISIGGILIAAGSTVTVVTGGTGSFTFNLSSIALYTENNAVGLPLFAYPFSVGSGGVLFRNHGKLVGQTFHVDKTTTVTLNVTGVPTPGIVTIPGGTDLVIATVPTVDTFTFNRVPFTTGPLVALVGSALLYEGQTGTYLNGVLQSSTFGAVISIENPTSNVVPATQAWFMDNLGETGLVVFSNSALYTYSPPIQSGSVLFNVGGGTDAPTAPQLNVGMFVAMPQAQVILFGTEAVFGSGTIDPLLLRFSDAGTLDTWTATASNQAGSYRLSRGSKIVGGIQAPQTTLIFTDLDLWSMSYQGPPLVYGFSIMGTNCGLVAPKAVTVLGRVTYWLGANNVWMFDGGSVKPLPCSVWNSFFDDLDQDNVRLVVAGSNSGTNEVIFFRPSLEDAPDPPTNLLAYSNIFTNQLWTQENISITTGLTGPDGNADASRLVEDTSTNVHDITQTLTKDNVSETMTIAVYAHISSTRWGYVALRSSLGSATLIFNPIAGAIISTTATGSWTISTSGTTTDTHATGIAGNGWLRYFITCVTDSNTDLVAAVGNIDQATSDIFYAGGGVNGLVLWGMQVNLGTILAYQDTTAYSFNNPTRYMKYNVQEGLWDDGILTRTAWLNDSIFGEGTPLAGDANFRIQHHEDGFDDDDQPMRNVYVESGYGTMSDGSQVMLIDQCQPDFQWFGINGGVYLTLKSLRYPGGPQSVFGPYSITPTTQYFSTRVRSKHIAIRYDWAPIKGFSARVGSSAFRIKPAGTRP